MSKLKLAPITGGWRVVIGSALAGTIFLLVKPAIQKEHQLMWAVVFGGTGAATAWALELYKPAVRIGNDQDDNSMVVGSNQTPTPFYSNQTLSLRPLELKLSPDLTEAVKTLSSLVANQSSLTLPTATVQELTVYSDPAANLQNQNFNGNGNRPDYTQLTEVTRVAKSVAPYVPTPVAPSKPAVNNLIIEEDYLAPADNESTTRTPSVEPVNNKVQKFAPLQDEDNLWGS